jgi:hypothetical protein
MRIFRKFMYLDTSQSSHSKTEHIVMHNCWQLNLPYIEIRYVCQLCSELDLLMIGFAERL